MPIVEPPVPSINISNPRFMDYPDFKPLIGGEDLLLNGVEGGTLFYGRLNAETTKFINPNDPLVVVNSKKVFDVANHPITGVVKKPILIRRPLIDPTEYYPYPLWYYMFCKGRRTPWDPLMIDYRKRAIEYVYRILITTHGMPLAYNQTTDLNATQLLLELSHPRNYEINGNLVEQE